MIKVEALREEGIAAVKNGHLPLHDTPLALLPPCDKTVRYEPDMKQRELAVVFPMFDGKAMPALRNSLTWAAYSLARFTDVSDKGIPIFLAVEPSIMDSVQVYLDLIPDHPYQLIPMEIKVGDQHPTRYLHCLSAAWEKPLRDYRQVLSVDADNFFIPVKDKTIKQPLVEKITEPSVRDLWMFMAFEWKTEGVPVPVWTDKMTMSEFAAEWASICDMTAEEIERLWSVPGNRWAFNQTCFINIPMRRLRQNGEAEWFERAFEIGGHDEGLMTLYFHTRQDQDAIALCDPEWFGNVYGGYVDENGNGLRQIPTHVEMGKVPWQLYIFMYPLGEDPFDYERMASDFVEAMGE